MTRLAATLLWLGLIPCTLGPLAQAEAALAQDGQAAAKSLTSFAELRAEVLDAISGASKRVWLVTDYLTDGEIVSALYLAQYRKLDVQVLLGRGKSNNYMSRLSYLKNQNIPVFLKPDTFTPGHPTALLVDERLLLVNGELDFLAKVRQYSVMIASPERRDAFHATFASAVNLRVPAVPHQTPLVGKYNPSSRIYAPAATSPTGGGKINANGTMTSSGGSGTVFKNDPSPRVDASGAYVYDRAGTPRPSDIPAKLPKAVKWGEGAPRREPLKPAAATTIPEARPQDAAGAESLKSDQHSPAESEPPALPADGD